MRQDRACKGRQFTVGVILWAVRWYLMFPVSYRDLELMLLDRGVEVDHTTIFRWIQAYAVDLEKRLRPHLRVCNGSRRVDETYVKVKGRWMYLYRAVDSCRQTIDCAFRRSRPGVTLRRQNASSARPWRTLTGCSALKLRSFQNGTFGSEVTTRPVCDGLGDTGRKALLRKRARESIARHVEGRGELPHPWSSEKSWRGMIVLDGRPPG